MNSLDSVRPAVVAAVPISAEDTDRHRALIVDDDDIDRRRLKSICDRAELNLEFHEVASLQDLRKALDSHRFDIIFLDYRLRDGDGLEGLSTIKGDPRHRSAATIMIAGVGQTSVAVSAVKAGCSDYILKDALDPNWLRRAVVNALDKSRLRREFDASEELRSTLEAALNRFSKDCIVEMKPMLSRMLRQVRRLRNDASRAATNTEDLEDLEDSCQRLWEFTDRISTYAERYST